MSEKYIYHGSSYKENWGERNKVVWLLQALKFLIDSPHKAHEGRWVAENDVDKIYFAGLF